MNILMEPPFRRVGQLCARYLPCSIRTKDRWNAADRPHYLHGLLYAADQAKREGVTSIAAIEFGVAEGYGLLALQAHAQAVERETGVQIALYGFDTGGGMPTGTGDYRDHPDVWAEGDYVMDVHSLQDWLAIRDLMIGRTPRTTLVLGKIGWMDTEIPSGAPRLLRIQQPVGFIAVDVDYYSSTIDCLSMFDSRTPRLRRVAMYFDDLNDHYNHPEAGELLAIREFNDKHAGEITIAPWRGLRTGPFPDATWHDAMYIAHNLKAISATRLARSPAKMR